MNKEEFVLAVRNLGLLIDENILNKLEIYCDFLLEYNRHTNLTAIRDREEVYLKHFYDSLTICKVIDLNDKDNLMDIGSGAGFPGLVLKIFFPNLHVILVDSNNKKTKFLLELSQKLNVSKIEVINDRVENLLSKYINSIDVVTARAVTNLPVLVELAIPFVKKNAFFIAMKGNNEEELKNGLFAIKQLNSRIYDIQKFELPKNAGNRTLICAIKEKATVIDDIRPYDKIIKKPLVL